MEAHDQQPGDATPEQEREKTEREAVPGDQGPQIGGGGFDPDRPLRTSSPPPGTGTSPAEPDAGEGEPEPVTEPPAGDGEGEGDAPDGGAVA